MATYWLEQSKTLSLAMPTKQGTMLSVALDGIVTAFQSNTRLIRKYDIFAAAYDYVDVLELLDR